MTHTPADPLGEAMAELEADPLYQAQHHLEQQRQVADAAGDWQTYYLLGPLIDVVDHARRVTLDTASAHYRADKAGALLDAAEAYQQRALLGYAGWPAETDDGFTHPTEKTLNDSFALLAETRSLVVAMGWLTARDSAPTHSDVDELRSVARKLNSWAEQLDQSAVDDDHYDWQLDQSAVDDDHYD